MQVAPSIRSLHHKVMMGSNMCSSMSQNAMISHHGLPLSHASLTARTRRSWLHVTVMYVCARSMQPCWLRVNTRAQALSPHYFLRFFIRNGPSGWKVLAGVLLSVTGTEAMFAGTSCCPTAALSTLSLPIYTVAKHIIKLRLVPSARMAPVLRPIRGRPFIL